MACGCGKSREERLAERIARSERIREAREAQAARRAELRAARIGNMAEAQQPAKVG